MGEWYYPDGEVVKNNAETVAAGENFYRVRNAPQVVRLAHRGILSSSASIGSYCCRIPTTQGNITFCASIGR